MNNKPDDEFSEVEALLLPRARALKAQAARLHGMAEDVEATADRVFAILDKAKAPDADPDALLPEVEALGKQLRESGARWYRSIKEINALNPGS